MLKFKQKIHIKYLKGVYIYNLFNVNFVKVKHYFDIL